MGRRIHKRDRARCRLTLSPTGRGTQTACTRTRYPHYTTSDAGRGRQRDEGVPGRGGFPRLSARFAGATLPSPGSFSILMFFPESHRQPPPYPAAGPDAEPDEPRVPERGEHSAARSPRACQATSQWLPTPRATARCRPPCSRGTALEASALPRPGGRSRCAPLASSGRPERRPHDPPRQPRHPRQAML